MLAANILSIKYRDIGSRDIGFKAYALEVDFVLIVLCDIFALIYISVNNAGALIFYTVLILFAAAFIVGLYGIYHAQTVIANLQPRMGRRHRVDIIAETSAQL